MSDVTHDPKPGQVWGHPHGKPSRWCHINRVYTDRDANGKTWVYYGDDEQGGGMLPLDLWNEWVRSSGAVLIEEPNQ